MQILYKNISDGKLKTKYHQRKFIESMAYFDSLHCISATDLSLQQKKHKFSFQRVLENYSAKRFHKLDQCLIKTEHELSFIMFYKVYDGSSETSTLLKSACGKDKPDPIRSTGNSMLVKFVVDPSVTMKGFSATFTSPGGSLNPQQIGRQGN